MHEANTVQWKQEKSIVALFSWDYQQQKNNAGKFQPKSFSLEC